MSSQPDPQLVRAVLDGIEGLLPAHESYAIATTELAGEATADRACGDVIHVQGRGDRLHGVWCAGADSPEDVEGLEAFTASPVNWRWVAVPVARVAAWRAWADAHGVGMVSVAADGALDRLSDAAPNPGIFIKKHAELRKTWRTIAPW